MVADRDVVYSLPRGDGGCLSPVRVPQCPALFASVPGAVAAEETGTSGEAGARTGMRSPHVGGIPARHRSAGPGGAGRHQPDLTGCESVSSGFSRYPATRQILVIPDVFLDECVSVVGDVASRDAGELVVEMDRGEYVQHVKVRGPAEVFEQVPLPGRVQVAAASGRMRSGDTWSITEWTAGGGVTSVRTFQGTSSRPRSAHFVRKATTTTAMSNYEERPHWRVSTDGS